MSEDTTERIRHMMERKNMSQAQAARYLGVPPGTLCNWLTGYRKPPTVVVRLLDVLGTVEALAPGIHEALARK